MGKNKKVRFCAKELKKEIFVVLVLVLDLVRGGKIFSLGKLDPFSFKFYVNYLFF